MCTFCRIIAGELPSRMIYEDEKSCVFLDISGDVDAHMLAVPKRHVESLIDCDEDTLFAVMHAVKAVTARCIARGFEGVNLLNASGKSAGQSVGHLHFHLIPRRTGDDVDAWPHFTGARMTLSESHELLK